MAVTGRRTVYAVPVDACPIIKVWQASWQMTKCFAGFLRIYS
ncbi:hypothetical protein [Desulfobacter sp.]